MRILARNLTVIALALVAVSQATPVLAQGVPSPANSICPTSVTVAPDGTCCFDVIVRDAANIPIAGSTVRVDFGTCAVTFCPTQPPGVTVVGNGVVAVSDATGRARFCVCATFTPPCNATITADGVVLCTVSMVNGCVTPIRKAAWGRLKVLYR